MIPIVIFREIDDLLAHVQVAGRTHNGDFYSCNLAHARGEGFARTSKCTRTLFYIAAIIENEAFDFSINNAPYQATRSCTLFFTSPFHLFDFSQKAPAKGYCFFFTEPFIQQAYPNGRFHQDFSFFWENECFHFISKEQADILLQLGERIHAEFEKNGAWSDNIIADYLHILLIESKRLITPKGSIQDHSADYHLLQQFYKLIKGSYPIIKSVEAAAGILSVTPARLWLATKRITGETPSEIINRRVLTEAQHLLLHSTLTVSEISFYLDFKEKSHFTRFFKNLTGVPPVDYIKQFKKPPTE
ncbi:MAG: helix-turn-helix transcriptional regulator [Chitinophaga sp.]|uniref:helix-turn-helix domain-containing protein n=1 Tax=Chitinophaga sp. TaxID=1869181 RepID=UPI0025BA17A8|nr:AraC family transcriptional regulator [Chitinophaga sp.]MBV8251389.1 helix-turn-helix transcriptional regulator [Chitinophaga sp.]